MIAALCIGLARPGQAERTIHLDNGAKIVLLPAPGTGRVAAKSLYPVGFIHEPEGMTRAAHLVGHSVCFGAAGERPDGVRLADLRGKVVLPYLWGHWCGPCPRSMPDLMKLHEHYTDKGLVIITVHDDSAASIADMDVKLATARETLGGGKDTPLCIALDAGGATPILNHTRSAPGATAPAYGVQFFRTQVIMTATARSWAYAGKATTTRSGGCSDRRARGSAVGAGAFGSRGSGQSRVRPSSWAPPVGVG